MKSVRRILCALCACAALGSLAGCGASGRSVVTVSAVPAAAASTGSNSLQQHFVEVIGRVAPTVVQISTPHGLGSGVAFDDRGDVVTNAHVVAGGGPLHVTDSRGHSYAATLVGSFTPDDLAVVHAAGASLRSATFAGSRAVQDGDIVLAIGNPLGLRSSVTEGIISAVGRTVDEPNGVVLPDVIQTSAPINPGNSGGALVDLDGDVVGIPTLAATDPEFGGTPAPGIGFAIPSSLVTDIAGQIVKHGHVTQSHRAYLGVELATGVARGAAVVSVQRGSPAARAGIVPGDVITSIDGQPITSPVDVATVLATLAPGRTVSVGITKPNGSSATVRVRLGQYPGSGT